MKDAFTEGLKIRQLEEKDLDQYNELLSYVFQVTGTDIEESGYANKREMVQSKRPILVLSTVFGWFDHEKLVSQIAIYPCEVNIHGTIYKMGGVTGVGTYPEYARQGLMRELVSVALKNMRDDKQWISYLYPYNIPYYRDKGWEIMSDKLSFKIRDTQLPKFVQVAGSVERHEVDYSDVLTVYDQFSKINHGALQRSAFHWEEYWREENKEERIAAVYYDAAGQPKGVLFYWVAEEVFHVKEMFYLNQEARHGLWNFIGAHFSMVYWIEGDNYKDEPLAFFLDDSQIKETIAPYFMARIVDVEEFLREFPFKSFKKPFHFVVSDPMAEWNRGVFGMKWDEENEKVQVIREPIGDSVILDIQTLTCLLMNYRRAAYLYQVERIDTNQQTLRILEEIIPDMAAYFSDYF
ncbi:MAG TPA: GNAT family N-acetyltransferase [Candidatus Enterococcus avicola]|uniref:GNAT family N-acetyltransferase n=1 Tax=Candidatus Enterococcus avicola TaxID=2838561 RepID=A0A9D2JIQ6_9ENTE|nr:GNAT family N-acetyltransferase [Candidatus Enterococcus avicola]